MKIDAFNLDGPRQGPATDGPAQQLVILLHGLGADGNDLFGLAPQLGQILPDAAFAAPHAPFPCDMAPFGHQWFSLQDRRPEAVLSGVKMAAPALNDFIDRELERYGLDDSQLALFGFSQGTMMALYVSLRRAKPCATVIGFSGVLVAPEVLAEEIVCRPPVLLVHGDADEVVPVQALPAAVAALQANRVPVTSQVRPGLGHGIDPTGLGLAVGTLQTAFGLES